MLLIFEFLFFIGNPDKICKGKKLICYILGTEGCRKLKFGNVGLVGQNFSS